MEDRRTEEVVDITARHQIDTHEKECAIRYEGIRRDYHDTNDKLDKISDKLDNFRTLVLISVIVFFFGVAASLYKSTDSFTETQGKQQEARIQKLEEQNAKGINR